VSRFILVIVDEGEPGRVEELETKDQLIVRMQELFAERERLPTRQVFIVEGRRWFIVPGDFPYLVETPLAVDSVPNFIPLFTLPSPSLLATSDFLGTPEVGLDSEYSQVTKRLRAKAETVESEDDSDSPF
jgi:hypothetical protein